MEKMNSTIDIFKSAILLERKGHAFYRKMSEVVDNDELRELFKILAEEEMLHEEYLSKEFVEYVKTDKVKGDKFAEETFIDTSALILSDEAKEDIESAGFEAAAISAAIEFENKAIMFYSESAREADNPDEKKLFEWLANFERSHHRLLAQLDEDLKEKIWYNNSFWPF